MKRLLSITTSLFALIAACGDGGDDSNGSNHPSLNEQGVDASSDREEAVLQAYCENAFQCDELYGYDVEMCKDNYVHWSTDTEECTDAQLDTFACYAKAACEGFNAACKAQEAKKDELCD